MRDKTVVVTGAAHGIGRALALGFLADGARVVAGDIDEAGLLALAVHGMDVMRCDVSREDDVRVLMKRAVSETGRLDVLFNNAGLGDKGRIEDLETGAFERMVGVHLFGGYYGLRHALPIMRAQGYGRIINMLSRGAEARAPHWASYAASKAGLFALTRVAAAEAEGFDILINGMIPGPTRTQMNDRPPLQPPEAVYPAARWLASLPANGPSGQVFWNCKPYKLFAEHPAGDDRQ